MNPAPRVAWPALTVVLGVLVSVGAVGVTGSGSPLPAVRAGVLTLVLLAAAGVLGAVLAARSEAEEARRSRLLDAAAVVAATWTVAAAVVAFLLFLGTAPVAGSAAFGPGLVAFLTEVPIGRTWAVAAAAPAVLTALLVATRSARGVTLLAPLSAAAAFPVALQQAVTAASIGAGRILLAAATVQVLALVVWAGATASGAGRRVLAPAAFAALGVATAAGWPTLAAQGWLDPLALATAGVLVVAGSLTLLAAIARVPPPVHRVQGLLLGIGAGLGAAGSITRPLPAVSSRTTPAEILTGSPLPAPPSLPVLLAAWRPDPFWVVVAAVLLAAYAAALVRLRGTWSPLRTLSWGAGVVLLGWLTSGGPAQYAALDLGVHLAQHAALLLLVPLLLAGGGPLRLMEAVRPGAGPGPAVPPVPAVAVALVGAVVLYGTGLLGWSVSDPLGAEAVAGASVGIGLLLVRGLLQPGARRRSAVAGAVVLLLAEAAGVAALAAGPSLLLADWYGALGWGVDALAAQRAGALAAAPVAVLPTVVLLVLAVRSPRTAPTAAPRAAVAS